MSKSNLKRYDLREDFRTLPRGNPSYYVEVSMTDALGMSHVWKCTRLRRELRKEAQNSAHGARVCNMRA